MPSVEFANADANQAWAGDPLTSSDNNRELKDCTGNSLIVYTSAYASFANARTPFRNGQISGIMKIYRGDGELIIRDLSDVNMNDLRCDGSSGNPVYIPLDSVRLLDPGSTPTALPGDKFIRVIVTSDNTTNMINGQNLYCQDQTAGIQIRFSGTHSFALGTQLEINVSGQELSNYRGVLQINNVPLTSATVIAPPTFSITPRVATLADLNTNYDQWEGQLVKVNAVTLTGATTYAGSLTMDDGTGTMILYTSTSATFSGSTVPTGPVNVTGLLIEYNGTKEIIIRNISDVQ
jgi:DNA/RNA endonuclease YhcR with UshA esterase domain